MCNKANLHSNIFRILKYLVFIFGFCFIFSGSGVEAETLLEVEKDGSYSKVTYDSSNTYIRESDNNFNVYFKSSLTLTFQSSTKSTIWGSIYRGDEKIISGKNVNKSVTYTVSSDETIGTYVDIQKSPGLLLQDWLYLILLHIILLKMKLLQVLDQ